MNESWPDARGEPDPETGMIPPWTREMTAEIDDKDGHWRPIRSAPPHLWIEVCGRSGTHISAPFLAMALWVPNHWLGVDDSSLSERGWVPQFWRPWAGYPRETETSMAEARQILWQKTIDAVHEAEDKANLEIRRKREET